MNTPNNKRKKESIERIERAFVNELQSTPLQKISVTKLCAEAKVNRTTFYANYLDVYDLAEKLGQKLEAEIDDLYADERAGGYNSFDFLKLVNAVYENRIFFQTWFRLGLDASYAIREYDVHAAETLYGSKHIDYHILFFMSGFNAMLKKWLLDDCPFPPEEFIEIINAEYLAGSFFSSDASAPAAASSASTPAAASSAAPDTPAPSATPAPAAPSSRP